MKATVLLFPKVQLKGETFPSYQTQRWKARRSSIQRKARKERKRNTAQKYSSSGTEQEDKLHLNLPAIAFYINGLKDKVCQTRLYKNDMLFRRKKYLKTDQKIIKKVS